MNVLYRLPYWKICPLPEEKDMAVSAFNLYFFYDEEEIEEFRDFDYLWMRILNQLYTSSETKVYIHIQGKDHLTYEILPNPYEAGKIVVVNIWEKLEELRSELPEQMRNRLFLLFSNYTPALMLEGGYIYSDRFFHSFSIF